MVPEMKTTFLLVKVSAALMLLAGCNGVGRRLQDVAPHEISAPTSEEILEEAPACVPGCSDRKCGDDGCGGTCGECPPGWSCNGARCDEFCVPACEGIECGDDGCGNSCGECPDPGPCEHGVCQCAPSCSGKECGPDGCDGSCGLCPGETYCDGGKCRELSLELGSPCAAHADCASYWCVNDPAGKFCSIPCFDNCPAGYECLLYEDAWDEMHLCFRDPDAPEPSGCEDALASSVVQRVAFKAVGDGGHPGEALDLDDDPATCAPESSCSGGYDNQLHTLIAEFNAFELNDQLGEALEQPGAVRLAGCIGMNLEGEPFALNIYAGRPQLEKEECNYLLEDCPYYVQPAPGSTAPCGALGTFDNATILNGKLTAGGPGYQLRVALLHFSQPEPVLYVTARLATIEGVLDATPDGKPFLVEGVLGYVLVRDEIMVAVDELPEQYWDDAPVNAEMFKFLVETYLPLDIDTDGDGQLDASSAGVKFFTLPGEIVGVLPE